MAERVLALKTDGSLSYCIAPPELRGKGRCNHIAHQEEGESPTDFIDRIERRIYVGDKTGYEVIDQKPLINNIIEANKKSYTDNPDWESVINEDFASHFTIGKGETLENVDVESVDKELVEDEDGNLSYKLNATVSFRGKTYDVDLGEVPYINEDGTMRINGCDFRYIPVVSQFKSGYVQFDNSTVIKQVDGHVAMTLTPGSDEVKIGGSNVDINEVQKYFNGEDCKLTDFQKYCIDNIDPIAFERSPNIKTDLAGFRDSHTPDEPNDLSWRKVISYEDNVRSEMNKQFRRMGVTFRTNLNKQMKAEESGDPKQIEKANKLPLFFQKNLTSNIKTELTTASNVQVADDLNPLAALSQNQKLSLVGPGGYNKDKAPAELRDIHPSYKDKIDPLDMTSGKNVGLSLTLKNADIDDRGFIVDKAPDSKDACMTVSDFIPYRYNCDPNRATMAVAQMKQACPIKGGEDPRKLGDQSDKAWESISGAKLGANLNVAYIPMKENHEDAILISRSCARKFETEQTDEYRFNKGPNKGKEKRGVKAKSGMYVEAGTTVDGLKVKYGGEITNVTDKGFDVKCTYPMSVGDKITNRAGGKSIVAKILDDNEMPKIKQDDGSYVTSEIVMSPIAVQGRMNISQVYEAVDGPQNFGKNREVLLEDGKKKVEATAGKVFFMRLNHIGAKKLQTHMANEKSNKEYTGSRSGEMENLLLSDSPKKREILSYLRNQENSDVQNKFSSLLKSVGVNIDRN